MLPKPRVFAQTPPFFLFFILLPTSRRTATVYVFRAFIEEMAES